MAEHEANGVPADGLGLAPHEIMTPFWTLTLLATAIAAWTDFRTGHIPNWLTGTAFVAGIVGHAVSGGCHGGAAGAAIGVAWAVAGALACAAAPLVLFVRGAMGGGDLKLFVALGALMHPMQGLELELHAFVVAVTVVLGQIVHRGTFFATLARVLPVVLAPFRKESDESAVVPAQLLTWFRLGPSIFVGAVVTWLLRRG